MTKSRKKKPMVYEKPRLIRLGSNDVAEGQYCTTGGTWPDDCNAGSGWTPSACEQGDGWTTECNPGGGWTCITGGQWEEICMDGLGNMVGCEMGDGYGGGDCIEFGQMFD